MRHAWNAARTFGDFSACASHSGISLVGFVKMSDTSVTLCQVTLNNTEFTVLPVVESPDLLRGLRGDIESKDTTVIDRTFT